MSYNHEKNINRNNYRNRNERVGQYVPPHSRKVDPRDDGCSMVRVEDILQKMRRRFDATDENLKEMRGEL